MENINNLGTISKEVLTILSYCDEDIINKVPNSLIKELVNYAGDSKVECFLYARGGAPFCGAVPRFTCRI